MNATSVLEVTDLARQRRFRTDLTDDLTPSHSVGHAITFALERMAIPEGDTRWGAFARGVKLDAKAPLEGLEEEDASWMLLPEVSAG